MSNPLGGLMALLSPSPSATPSKGLLGDPQSQMMLGASLLAAGGPSLTPKSGFEGIPQTMALMQRQQMLKQEQERQQKQQEATAAALGGLPGINAQLAQANPNLALDLWKAQQPKQSELTTMQKHYNQARSEGFEGTLFDFMTAQNIAQSGSDPRFGTTPAGYERFTREDGSQALRPLPGSADYTKRESLEKGQTNALRSGYEKAQAIIGEGVEAIKLINGGWTDGVVGQLAQNFRGSDAASLNSKLNTLKANTAFEALNAMRMASPTGGALGGVSEGELRLLAAEMGSLDPEQDHALLEKNIMRLLERYEGIVNRMAADPRAQELGIEPINITSQLRGAQGGGGSSANATADMYRR